ncbi:NmrA family NAD(P)-binding protein [Deminuibacter soli]|uniref:NAD-dependent epimerase/dehydratase family protein n=1 Tax=Deminuibacter soli TaxID=2291815 RepID=A0A3E1ND27_9BACT|nr:NmrA family NAD(P)-binding protein [Deminuibacter soli]RFM25678.1 NAD-dependent epimerase/dehydratase family protein [Deminuibacter soli]
MLTITGATGRVGTAAVQALLQGRQAVTAICRNEEKAAPLRQAGARIAIADMKDTGSLKKALEGTTVLFIITPESGKEKDVLGETHQLLNSVRQAIVQAGVQKIIGLSSAGAQYSSGTGNLLMSHMLEHAFTGMPIRQTFIRPAYYFSNWMMYLPVMQKHNTLPGFFPTDFRLPMIAPEDVGAFAATAMTAPLNEEQVYELEGPQAYSTADVAAAFSIVLNKHITAQQVPHDQWESTLQKTGFTPDAVRMFTEMTDAVIQGKAKREGRNTELVKLHTTLEQYITQHLHQPATA